MLNVWLPGPPVAASRPRVTKNGTYTPARYRRWKQAARDQLTLDYRAEPMVGPLTVVVDAYWPRPKRMRDGPRAHRMGNEDTDNVGKAVLDAGNGILYGDDRQVVELIVRKWYAGTGTAPGVAVSILGAVAGTDCTGGDNA